MQIAISVYQQQHGKTYILTPIVPGLFGWSVGSGDLGKARQRLIERVRKELLDLAFHHFSRLRVPPGQRLTRQHLELVLRDDGEKIRVTGFFPVVIEERLSHGERTLRLAYHPLRPAAWFEVSETEELSVSASRHYSRVFKADDPIDNLRSSGSEKLVTLRFQVEAPNLRRLLKSEKKSDERASPGRSGELAALLRVAINQTARAAAGNLVLGLPREPQRQRLRQLLCGPNKAPVLVVGPAGSGKSSLIAQAVQDLLDADDFASHGNLDRVHNVLSMGGRQIIAGMSYIGQWEARSVELLERAKQRRLLLWIDDVHAFPSIGKTNVSDRTLADFFQGPLARRELIMIGECSAEQLSSLQHTAPSFAAAFQIVKLEPATTSETLAMLLNESRRLEQSHDIAFDPRAFQTIVAQSGALASGTALPGRALGPLKALAKSQLQEAADDELDAIANIGADEVLKAFSSQTGLPELLLSPRASLTREALKSELAQQIMGQELALEAACDLILSLRTKLSGAGRPYGVFLFTGPTGTGKTELAKCLAEYLYGAAERLVRFDMGELGTPDAVSRLIGDQFQPDGLLTSRLRAQPFCVLLFDEVEKAHPSVLNLMLQIFEDARLGDARGNVTDFSHSVIIMTSNLGSAQATIRGFSEQNTANADLASAVRDFFPPELFNRIDRVVPFAPLDLESARAIVKKELSLLVARPGLSERSTFVRFTDAVVARVVDDAYDARYGARALKRHIDREIGEALTRTIVADGPAEMRLLWAFAESGGRGLGIRAEALREADPHPEPSSLLDLFDGDYDSLRQRIPAALARLASVEADGRLEQLGANLSAELSLYRIGDTLRASEIYNLDSLHEHARSLSRRMESRLRSDSKLEALERRRKLEQGEALTDDDFSVVGSDHARPFEPGRPRQTELGAGESGPERARALRTDLAEARLMEGLLASATEPDRHVALIEVLKLSVHHERRRFSKGNPGLAEWLVEAYSRARGQLDEAAVLFWDGSTRRLAPSDLEAALEARPQQVALRLVGPGVTDFLRAETGCHVRRTLATGPEIVRVRVLAGGHDPLAWVEQHRRLLQAFERGLEGRGELSDNPEQLLPVIRSLRFDPEPGQLAALRVEDYRLSYTATRRVRHIRELLHDLWLLGAGLPEVSPPAPRESRS